MAALSAPAHASNAKLRAGLAPSYTTCSVHAIYDLRSSGTSTISTRHCQWPKEAASARTDSSALTCGRLPFQYPLIPSALPIPTKVWIMLPFFAASAMQPAQRHLSWFNPLTTSEQTIGCPIFARCQFSRSNLIHGRSCGSNAGQYPQQAAVYAKRATTFRLRAQSSHRGTTWVLVKQSNTTNVLG